MIDTPGFGDTFRSDTDVLKEITYWLSSAYGYNVYLSGIIHLHPITAIPMTGSAVKSLRVLQKTWGTRILSSVAMVTTMWDIIKPDLGEMRENRLRSRLWQPIVEHGGHVARHDGTRSSALSIINLFMTKGKATLQIQHEMVDQHMMLKDTAAGQELMRHLLHPYFWPLRLSAKKNAEIAALGVSIEQLVAAKEKEVQEGLAEAERQLESDHVRYNAESKRAHTMILSQRYLHQVVSTGVAATSTAAPAACVVM